MDFVRSNRVDDSCRDCYTRRHIDRPLKQPLIFALSGLHSNLANNAGHSFTIREAVRSGNYVLSDAKGDNKLFSIHVTKQDNLLR